MDREQPKREGPHRAIGAPVSGIKDNDDSGGSNELVSSPLPPWSSKKIDHGGGRGRRYVREQVIIFGRDRCRGNSRMKDISFMLDGALRDPREAVLAVRDHAVNRRGIAAVIADLEAARAAVG